MSAEQLLERIARVRVVQQEAQAELAALVEHAIGLGIGWPEIASRLGVSRQAARQHFQRRHRDDASPEGGSS
jgi:predicted ArsR family transcriptional regulator